MKWLTANGEYLEISKMKTSHILHCLELLKRSTTRQNYIPEFKSELKRRNKSFQLYDQDGRFISAFGTYTDASTYKFVRGNSQWTIKS